MKLNKKTRLKGFTLVELLVVIAIIASLAALSTPVIFKQIKKGHMIEASKNGQQVLMLLNEFDGDYGGFPSDSSANSDVDLKEYVGEYSNDYLGQLIAGNYIKEEEIFFTRSGSSSNTAKKPDNVFTDKSNTLQAGECGFAYVKDLSVSMDSKTPVLMSPMMTKTTFNDIAYDGNAVVIRLDGSARQLRLSKDKKAKLPSGNTIFDIGENTVWGDEEPEVVLAK
ncbi:MAG: type II secretion system protein [Akkermansiaceae bacterium]